MMELSHRPKGRPKWLYFAPFLLNAPALTQRQWQVLGIVVLASIFSNYDVGLIQLALPQIRAELQIDELQLSNLGAIVKFGSLPAFLLMLAADRVGRRWIFLITVTLAALTTGATAFAPSANYFTSIQFLARMFTVAQAQIAAVIIVEEFPESARGWGIGAFTAIASYGSGAAALLFALVTVLPFGWRALYIIGLLPLLFIFFIARRLPETERFQQQSAKPNVSKPNDLSASSPNFIVASLLPVVHLLRAYPGRFCILGIIIFFFNFGGDAAYFFDLTYLQEEHGWQPGHISLLALGTGFTILLGSAYAGSLGDRFGRKRVMMLFMFCTPILTMIYYNVFGRSLPVMWGLMTFSFTGTVVLLSAVVNELFPTSYRSTAAGASSVVATISGGLSLGAHGYLLSFVDSRWTAVSLLLIAMFLAPFFVWLLPETSGRSLEEISPER